MNKCENFLACGYVFCDTCTHYRRIVRWIDPDYEVRVCKQCYNTEKLEPPMILTTNHTRDLADGSTLNRSETGNSRTIYS